MNADEWDGNVVVVEVVSSDESEVTVERCEYEDNYRRNEQEAEDARMAASFAGNNGGSGGAGSNNGGEGAGASNNGDGGSGSGNFHDAGRDETTSNMHTDEAEGPRRGTDVAPRAQAQPGVEQVSHSQPQVRVDDEKVASLVAMDFDPEKVVEALKKYDNNVEQALNELLSG